MKNDKNKTRKGKSAIDLILFISFGLIVSSCSQEEIDKNIEENGHVLNLDGQKISDMQLQIDFRKDYSIESIRFYDSLGLNRKQYYHNGRLVQDIRYFHSLKNGLWQEWHSNGNLYNRGNYTKGKKNGLFEEWYENGNLKSEKFYMKGDKSGIWNLWNKDGILDTTIIW